MFYEDETYWFLWTRFLGLNLLALTSYYVYIKQKKSLIKLRASEKNYLMGVSFYLTKEHGVNPRAVIDDTTLFKDISQAVAERGSENWQKFFKENSKDKAKRYAAQVPNRHKK